jgi:hypothetical protein
MSRFDVAWRKYWYRALPCGAISVGVVAFFFLDDRWPLRGHFQLAWLLYFAIWIASCEYLRRFPCPRRGVQFSRSLWHGKALTNPRCIHCGLKKFADPAHPGGAGIL